MRNADFALGPLQRLPALSLFLLGVRLESLLGRHVLVPLLLPLDTLQLLSLNQLTKSREGGRVTWHIHIMTSGSGTLV